MRIGFITQLLWERYGAFWTGLLTEAGADTIFADREATLAAMSDRRAERVPGLSFRLAVAQALALVDVDFLVAPALNSESESGRGGGQDPWIADFPAALATLAGVPRVIGVPIMPTGDVESVAISVLQQVARDPGRTRRIWDRHRTRLERRPLPAPSWGAVPGGRRGIGVVAQPWLLTDELAGAVAPPDAVVFSQSRIDPLQLRDEGSRVDARMIPTDQEVVGAARLLSRRGTIAEVHLIVDESSGGDAWLRSRVERECHKPLVVHELHDVLAGEEARLLRLPSD